MFYRRVSRECLAWLTEAISVPAGTARRAQLVIAGCGVTNRCRGVCGQCLLAMPTLTKRPTLSSPGPANQSRNPSLPANNIEIEEVGWYKHKSRSYCCASQGRKSPAQLHPRESISLVSTPRCRDPTHLVNLTSSPSLSLTAAIRKAETMSSQESRKKKNLIVDTDIFSDVEYVSPSYSFTLIPILPNFYLGLTNTSDAGALLLTATSPKINLLGVMVNKPSTYSVLAASAIVSYYTQDSQKNPVPIGVFRHPTNDGTVIPLPNSTFLDVVYWHLGEFASKIAYQFGSPSGPDYVKGGGPSIPWGHAEDAWSAVELYRKLLGEADDDSVTIVSIGFLDNLSLLLNSGPDSFSPLSGRQLISRKVAELVVMGGRYPEGRSWNFFGSDPDSPHHNGGNGLGLGPKGTANVINNWPTPQKDGWKGRVVYVGDEVGGNVLTGAKLVKEGPEGDPVGRAYKYYAYGEARPSWDPVAVLYAIDGLGECDPKLFRYDERYGYGRNWVDEKNGANKWVWDEETRNQFVLALDVDETTVAEGIDQLFLNGARAAVEKAGLSEEASPDH